MDMSSLDLANRRALICSLPENFTLGVEVGCSNVQFSEFILKNNTGHLFCVDDWEGRKEEFSGCIDLLKPWLEESRCTIIDHVRPDASKVFKDNTLDFIYISPSKRDGDFVSELDEWWKKLRVGGVFCGHNYSHFTKKNVYFLVNRFARKHGFDVSSTGITDESVFPAVEDLGDYDHGKQSWVVIKKFS